MPTEYEAIIVDKERGRARITLNRPEKLNALSRRLQAELATALRDADEDNRVHSIIIRGAGRSFCAGYDLAAPRGANERDGKVYRSNRTFDDDLWQLEKAQRLRMVLFDMHKPTIAQVHGYCLAGGTDIATLCDMVIVADDARIGFPPARDLGVLPNQMWLYHIGPQWAKRLLLTGDTITGAEAAEWGLFNRAVPADELDETVAAYVAKVARTPKDIIALQKQSANRIQEIQGFREAMLQAVEVDAIAHASPAVKAINAHIKSHGLQDSLRAFQAGEIP